MSLIILAITIGVFSGLWIVVSKREHLLSVLLSFEFISLSIYLILIIMLGAVDLYYSLIFITFTACEGALGLSVLVMMSRTHGGDYFKTFSILS